MEKEKIMLPIGNNKLLVFEADPADKQEQDFAKLCKEAAASQPKSLQEFFTRLHELQQQKPPEVSRKVGRKM